MKRLKWKDIPISVLESVYKKWLEVKVNSPGCYWMGCALCEYCSNKSLSMDSRCEVCPAVPKIWCVNGHGMLSRLHGTYHRITLSSMKGKEYRKEWKKDITKFLKFLRQHIKNRRRKVE